MVTVLALGTCRKRHAYTAPRPGHLIHVLHAVVQIACIRWGLMHTNASRTSCILGASHPSNRRKKRPTALRPPSLGLPTLMPLTKGSMSASVRTLLSKTMSNCPASSFRKLPATPINKHYEQHDLGRHAPHLEKQRQNLHHKMSTAAHDG